MNEYHVETILGAALFSKYLGLELNRSITIHFGKLGIDDCKAGKVLTAWLKSLGDYISKNGKILTCVWVRENGQYVDDKGIVKGSHVHILAHIPNECLQGVKQRQGKWLSKAAGARLTAGTIFGRKVKGASSHNGLEGLYEANSGNVIRYIIKGVDSGLAAKMGLVKVKDGGRVIGKRCGTTQNIGRKAWQRAGWDMDFLKAVKAES
ncbi:hypothetical protein [Sphingorhabdus lutea]|uniref:hypothetical protein n=1 Tax=Sphingorhabdus lutea TaxID=1913578 RepID=UPI0012EB509B|nr:hypothetical protein [Sphingorhabdus lutea]